jgi:hypothetical protein
METAEEQITKMQERLWDKGGLTEEVRAAHAGMFASGHCFICEKKVVEEGDMLCLSEEEVEGARTKHFLDWHSENSSQAAKDMRAKYEAEKGSMDERLERELLEEHGDVLEKVGEKRSGLMEIKCKQCNITYRSTLYAMIQHKKSHEEGKLPVVWSVRGGRRREKYYRPNEHVGGGLGLGGGSDAHFECLLVPRWVPRTSEKSYVHTVHPSSVKSMAG